MYKGIYKWVCERERDQRDRINDTVCRGFTFMWLIQCVFGSKAFSCLWVSSLRKLDLGALNLPHDEGLSAAIPTFLIITYVKCEINSSNYWIIWFFFHDHIYQILDNLDIPKCMMKYELVLICIINQF